MRNPSPIKPLPANTIFTEPLPYIWRGAFFLTQPGWEQRDFALGHVPRAAASADLLLASIFLPLRGAGTKAMSLAPKRVINGSPMVYGFC